MELLRRLRAFLAWLTADTVDVAGERVRLQGVDTPERDQWCRDSANVEYRCGQAATDALISLIGGRPIRCELEPERDRYGRALGVCFTPDGVDLNGWLVRHGYGLAYRQYSARYVEEEEAARAEGAGIHAGEFVAPWIWRAQN